MDYSKMTQEEFDSILEELIAENAKSLLSITGVYEVMSEHFNNDILNRWEERNPEEREIGKLKLEYDGSIVVCGEIIGRLEADCLSDKQISKFNAEIVRRWNLVEEKKPPQ